MIIHVSAAEIASEIKHDGSVFAEILVEIHDDFGGDIPPVWLEEFLDDLTSDGANFLRALAAALPAEEST